MIGLAELSHLNNNWPLAAIKNKEPEKDRLPIVIYIVNSRTYDSYYLRGRAPIYDIKHATGFATKDDALKWIAENKEQLGLTIYDSFHTEIR
jgi:hypothetical protein